MREPYTFLTIARTRAVQWGRTVGGGRRFLMQLRFTRFILAAITALALAAAGQPDPAQVLLEAAKKRAVVDGDLKAAIQQYGDIAASYGKSNRAAAATALVRMAECYAKLGDTESRQVYERVVKEYADQKEAVTMAQARLGALGRAPEARQSMVSRRLWSGAEVGPVGNVSADGRWLTFVDSTGDLAIRDLSAEKNRRLTKNGNWATDYAVDSTFSPDGKQIAYSWYAGGVNQIRVLPTSAPEGVEPPRVLLNNDEFIYNVPFSWTPDGKAILAVLSRKDRTNQIAMLSVPDGSIRILKSLEWRYPTRLSLSPDGRYIVYDAPVDRSSQNRDIYLLSTDGSREVSLVEHPAVDRVPLWTPDGQGVLFATNRGGNQGLWLIRVADGKADGDPVLVKSDAGEFQPQGITRDGVYHYTLGGLMRDLYSAEMDPVTGKLVKPAVPVAPGQAAGSWSPNGQFVAYFDPESINRKPLTIVIQSLISGHRRELFTNLTSPAALRWFPDGQSLLLVGGNFGSGIPISLHRIDVQTGEALLKRTIEARFGSDAGISSDGGKIYYTTHSEQSGIGRVMVFDIAADTESELYTTSPHKLNLALSPDGSLLALVLIDEAKRSSALHVMPATGGPLREVFRSRPGQLAGLFGIDWTPDGKHLLFAMPVEAGSRNMELWRVPVGLSEAKPLGLGPGNEFIIGPRFHPDGRHVVFVAGRKRWEAWTLKNFLPLKGQKN